MSKLIDFYGVADLAITTRNIANGSVTFPKMAYGTDSLTNVMLPKDWKTINKSGWDHFGFNQQWGGAPHGGRLPDGTDGEVVTGNLLAREPTDAFGNSVSVQSRATGFKVPTAISCDKATIRLKKVGNPTTDVEVYIYDDSVGLPGALITNGAATAQSGKLHSSNTTEILFTFPTPPSLVPDTQYHLVIKSPTIDASNYWLIDTQTTSLYPYGKQSYANTTPTWLTNTPAGLWFKIIPTEATSTVRDNQFYASDTTQLGQAPALTQPLSNFFRGDEFTLYTKLGSAPTSSKPIYQAYYDNTNHVTVEANASQQAVVRSNGSTITGTSTLSANDTLSVVYDGTDLHLYVNGIEQGTAITVSYADNFDQGSFILGGAIPTDLVWDDEQDMSVLPSADGWTFVGTGIESNIFSVNDDKLYQNKAGGSSVTGFYSKTTTLDNATGWRVDADLQVLLSPNSVLRNSVEIEVLDGTKRISIDFKEYFFEIKTATLGDGGTNIGYYQVDMKSSKRGVSILGKGSDFFIFIDGKLTFDGTGLMTNTTATNTIRFGDTDALAGVESDVIWHYVNYSESYEAPEFTNTPIKEFGCWQKDVSALLSDLSSSDVKSLTGLKENWVKETERIISTKGITNNPNTTSTVLIPAQEMNAFVLGSKISAKYDSVRQNNTTGGNAWAAFQLNGQTIQGTYRRFEHSNANDFVIQGAWFDNEIVMHGLHYVSGMWETSVGTSELVNIERLMKAEAK